MNILKRPMLIAALVCCVAASVSLYDISIAVKIVAVAVLSLIILIFFGKLKYIIVAVTVIIFAVNLFVQFNKIEQIKTFDAQKVSGRFLVTDEPLEYENFNIFTLKTTDGKTLPKDTKYLVFDYKKTQLYCGDIIDATVKITAIEDGDEFRFYDYGNGIYATASVVSFEKTNLYNRFYKFAGDIRSYVKNAINQRFSGDTAGLLLALTTGDKSLISKEFSLNVNSTGISHVIVVSGMHLSIIMMAAFLLVDRLFYNKYMCSLLSIGAIVVIGAVCGFTMSVIRAGVMFIIGGLAPLFNRDNDALSSLLTAVTVVLAAAPFAIVNISFQLSVLSTLALIWLVPFYSRFITKFYKDIKILRIVTDIGLCSVFAIIFTLPVTIKTFGYVSVVAPITNLLINYPVTVALVFNIGALVLSAIPFMKILSNVLFWVAGLASQFTVFIVNKIAELPITTAILPQRVLWFSIALIAAVIAFVYVYEYKLKKKRSDFNADSV